MSLRKYTYRDEIYFFDANKIDFITNVRTTFSLLFDNQKSINIGFQNYTEGLEWIENNILVGEDHNCQCP